MVPCVYCLDNGALLDEQVVWRGHDLYLCAPRGQLVEGYLVAAPYRCIGCLAELSDDQLAELRQITLMIAGFYRKSYGVRSPLFYEQGRAGGGAVATDFPLHAHLCGLPLDLDLHAVLAARYPSRPVGQLMELPTVAAGVPYAYVDSRARQRVYVPADEAGTTALERLRLKLEIAALAGIPERGHWRDYPGDRELQRLIGRFAAHREGTNA